MELVLNLTWAVLASTMVCLWMRFAPRNGASRMMQLAALAALILILFPVVSVTDDLQAALNPAEVDCCLRKDHVCPHQHALVPAIATLPAQVQLFVPATQPGIAIRGPLDARPFELPALASIQNRPPPAAA
jgi:hypothetical protein